MKKVCSWCKKNLENVPSELFSDAVITHGICVDCLARHIGPQQSGLLEYIDGLAAPVLVVDTSGCVKTANRLARTLLQKELPEIEGFRGGDVFECAFATLPGGCGNSVHCDACTIRKTVMDTFQSGESHLMTPAYLLRGTPDNTQETSFLISTEKVDGIVLLRIDKVGDCE